jgi:hypothetical protein
VKHGVIKRLALPGEGSGSTAVPQPEAGVDDCLKFLKQVQIDPLLGRKEFAKEVNVSSEVCKKR